MDVSVARAAASVTSRPTSDQQIDARRPVDDEQHHGAGERERSDGQPRHARDAAPEHAVPGGRAGDHDAAQQDQAARELAHRHGRRRVRSWPLRPPARRPPPAAGSQDRSFLSSDVHRRPARRRLRWLEDAERIDLAIYAAIARTPTPALDRVMSRLSRAADYSRLSLAAAALLALAGGRTGRRAAGIGLASLAVTATVVNVAVKPLGRRRRPDRLAGDVPLARHVRMPISRSFPSGHTAAAFAFATGVGHVSPAAAVPLRALAAAGRLLAHPHRGALPRRRTGRRTDRHHARAAHDARGRPARPPDALHRISSPRGHRDPVDRRLVPSPVASARHRPNGMRSHADRTMRSHARRDSMTRRARLEERHR